MSVFVNFAELLTLWNSGKPSIFKKNRLSFIQLCANSIFDIHKSYGIKFLIRLRLGKIAIKNLASVFKIL